MNENNVVSLLEFSARRARYHADQAESYRRRSEELQNQELVKDSYETLQVASSHRQKYSRYKLRAAQYQKSFGCEPKRVADFVDI